ncbi:RluA family pseudouridine synthase [Rheinheimera nanhaiensis]|uniref:Pseudouridine synthase n=1 Tax=Rheinheimera nanhaiensis E407-8 TaxID=562729 RepID=I1E1Z4_9GAMM|nr:RluA family pseudouridine synthase [Rheinheimera nanhaiensis]GAB60322.1 tRNA pseudouridine32 synthase [Rheinheimera nanhaiensis E407-8]
MTSEFSYHPPTEPWLDILYQDKDLIVLNKPSGLLTNPGRGAHLADSLLSRVQQQFPLAQLVHRLDLATSGVVVMALRRKAEAALKQQFADRLVKKRYLALVWGQVTPTEGVIELPLMADSANPPRQKVCFVEGKPAITHYRVLQQLADRALVELKPVTGRSHQLRMHMLHLGHPILGDAFYAHAEALNAAPRLMLHAASLQVLQPYHGTPLTFIADTDFVTAAGQLTQP